MKQSVLAGRRGALPSGELDHLAGVGEGALRDLQAPQHAGDLPNAGVPVQGPDGGYRGLPVGALADLQVVMALGGHLGQVGDAKHLAALAEPTQQLT